MRQLRHFRCFIGLLFIIFTENKGEPWKTDLIAEMVKLDPKERPLFSTIVEILEKHLGAPSSRSSFPSVSGKVFLNNLIYSRSRANKISFPTTLNIAHSLP